MKRTNWTGLAAALCMALTPEAGSALVISELFYDAVGVDDGLSFVELYGAPGTSLDGLVVEGINGANGAVTHSLVLSGAVPDDGIFVLADGVDGGASFVPDADLVLDFDFQNGPDSVALRSGEVVLDALGYGVFAPGDVFAGLGTPAPDVPAGASLARRFANVNSGDNFADFIALDVPTPGSAPLVGVPEPGTALLVAAGLAGFARSGARRRRMHPARSH
ncbi:MAG TPA: PEP-CTERM sorting domain-containing protein [Myxococcota bacterium]